MNDSSQVRGLLHLRMCIFLQMSVTRRVFRRIPRVQAHRYRRGWANKVKERFWYSANSHSVMVACAYHLFFSPFAPSHARHHCGSGTTSAQAFAETAAEAPDSARISSRLERRSSANDLAPKGAHAYQHKLPRDNSGGAQPHQDTRVGTCRGVRRNETAEGREEESVVPREDR